MTDYQSNPLRRRLAAGEIGIVTLGFNSAEMCDFLGPMGFDAVFVDFEHGASGWHELSDISRACDLWEMGTAVRVPRIDETLILRALDLGASSIIVPHVITPEEAERAARACRYPPEGNRGVAGNRRSYGTSDYFRRANEEVQCIALIEDAQALENLDALLQVDGIDIYQVAPSDLAASMGHLGEPRPPRRASGNPRRNRDHRRGRPHRRHARRRRERRGLRGGRRPLPDGPLAEVGGGRGGRPFSGGSARWQTPPPDPSSARESVPPACDRPPPTPRGKARGSSSPGRRARVRWRRARRADYRDNDRFAGRESRAASKAEAAMAHSNIYVGVAGYFGRPHDAGAVGVFRRRTDGGEWEHVLAAPEVHAVFVHPEDPDLVFAGTSDGVWRSTDRGASFRRAGFPDDGEQVWSLIAIDDVPDRMYAGGSPLGVYRSEDRGASWDRLPTPEIRERCGCPFSPRVMRMA